MARTPTATEPWDAMVRAALRGELNEAQARHLYSRGADAVAIILTAMARRLAELQSQVLVTNAVTPSTPSGMIPVYAKPAARGAARSPEPRRDIPAFDGRGPSASIGASSIV